MSFYAHLNMWEEISEHTRKEGCTLTVYMDDITISGPQVPERLMWKIKKG